MSEIKINEYVRTKSGFIGRVIARHGGYGLHYELDIKKELQDNMMNGIVHEDNIKDHKDNIIDLIEAGDYVNGCLVIEISRHRKTFTILSKIGLQKYEFEMVRKGTVKAYTIVTKEQFKNIEYKVGG